jgi:moderate conductance mechanosensitive channel
VVGLTALSQLGINTAPLIAGASIFGVALGFGSQKLVQDFITGIFLLTENAMQVGDWVTVAGVSGTVEFLSIRTVRLRGGDGSLYTVPFSSVTTVNNTNRGIGNAAVKVMIANGADLERAIATLKEIGADIRNDDAFKNGILSDFAYWGVDSVDGASVTLVGQIQCKDSSRWGVQREFNRRVLTTFTERGIELANPQRNFLINLSNEHDVEGRDDEPDDTQDSRGRRVSSSGGGSAQTRNGQNTPRGKPN